MITVRQECKAYSDELYTFQLAIAENTVDIILEIGGDPHALQILTASEGIIPDMPYGGRNFNLGETLTAGEGIVADGGHTLRKGDGGEIFAFIKGLIAYYDDAVRQRD